MEMWRKQGPTIEIIIGGILQPRCGFELEVVQETQDIIFNLIVSVKAQNTVAALQTIAHRLTKDSTILFLQNGMGIVDEINNMVFMDEKTRPNYVLGIVTHGVYSISSFRAVHAGMGTISLGVVQETQVAVTSLGKIDSAMLAPSTTYLLQIVSRNPILAASTFPLSDFLRIQLEKLAINAVVNPLTVMFQCRNGELFESKSVTKVMRLLLSEISSVIQALPELQRASAIQLHFTPTKLEAQVLSMTYKTSRNYSSMLQDVRQGRGVEIDYINGYIVRRGEELGISCAMNCLLLHMVKGRLAMVRCHLEGEKRMN